VYVGRGSRWGNPHDWCVLGRAEAVRRYAEALTPEDHTAIRVALQGKDLLCWCALDVPCHADVLLEIATHA
jgi:hypothetical protein